MEESGLKILWMDPDVLFKGQGIGSMWRTAMIDRGWKVTTNPEEIDDVDLVFFSSDSQLRADLIGKKPTICWFWGWWPRRFMDDLEGPWQAYGPKIDMLRACTRVLVPSPGTLDQLRMLVHRDGLLCPVGINTERIHSIPEQTRVRQLMVCGRLAPHKQVNMAIAAAKMLDPSPRLIICGPGDRRPFIDYASKLGLDSAEVTRPFVPHHIDADVIFCELSDEEKFREMKRTAYFIHASEYEGWGLPPMEALLSGTITLMLDTPHNRWVFKETVFYFRDEIDLANVLCSFNNQEVFQDAVNRTAMGFEYFDRHNNLGVLCDNLWMHIFQTYKEWLGTQLREHPDKWAEIYDLEHRRNLAYAGKVSPPEAQGPARFDPQWARHWRAQTFIDKLNSCGAQRIVDIGCGPVYPTIFALAGFEVTAVDISQECLRQVQEIANNWGVLDQITPYMCEAENMGPILEGGLWDAAVLGEILEHVPAPQLVLDKARNSIKSGGLIIATTPVGTHHYDPMHLTVWDDQQLSDLANSIEGMELVELTKIAEQGHEASCYLMVLRKV